MFKADEIPCVMRPGYGSKYYMRECTQPTRGGKANGSGGLSHSARASNNGPVGYTGERFQWNKA